MTIVVDDSILGLWFLPLSSDCDYLAALNRLPDGELKMQWRFRYREGAAPDAWNQHRKRWYESRTRMPEQAAIAQAREAVRVIATSSGQPEYWELIRGAASVDEFTAALAAAPFAHVLQTKLQPKERNE